MENKEKKSNEKKNFPFKNFEKMAEMMKSCCPGRNGYGRLLFNDEEDELQMRSAGCGVRNESQKGDGEMGGKR